MVEQPGRDREPNPDDANDAQLPGPEDGPVRLLCTTRYPTTSGTSTSMSPPASMTAISVARGRKATA